MLMCRYGHRAKIVHFLGRSKPWNVPYIQQISAEVPQRDSNRNLEQYVQQWWSEYYGHRETHVNEPGELQESELTDHLNMMEATPCSSSVATSSDVRLEMFSKDQMFTVPSTAHYTERCWILHSDWLIVFP